MQKGKYQGKWKASTKTKAGLILLPIVLVVLLLRQMALQPDVKGFAIAFKALCSAVALYFSYFWKKDNPIPAKLLLIAIACLPWLTMLGLSVRQVSLIETVLFYVSACWLLFWLIKMQISHWPVLCSAFFLLINMWQTNSSYTYTDDNASLRFWYIYLVIGFVVAVGTAVLLAKGILRLKKDTAGENIAVFILALILGFTMSWTTANNINYIFDTSEAVVYSLPLEEKNINSGRRRKTEYELTVSLEGEKITVEVSRSAYYQYAIGDLLPLSYYEGFLGDSYYILE